MQLFLVKLFSLLSVVLLPLLSRPLELCHCIQFGHAIFPVDVFEPSIYSLLSPLSLAMSPRYKSFSASRSTAGQAPVAAVAPG